MINLPAQRPAYQVKPVKYTVIEDHFIPVKEKVVNAVGEEKIFTRFRREKKPREVNGYMVYMPRGHSIRLDSREALQRLGFTDTPAYVDMNTGYRFAPPPQHDLATLGESIISGDEAPSHDPFIDKLVTDVLAEQGSDEKLDE